MRHGETRWNEEGRLQGSVDIPLNDYGIELAEKTRDGLKRDGISFDKVFTSPYSRAKQTAQIVAGQIRVPITEDDRLREVCFGAYEGVKISDIYSDPAYAGFAEYFRNPPAYEREGTAESYEEVFARASAFLQEEILPLEGKYENVLVVCHGAIVRAILSLIRELPLEKYWTISQPNCCVNVVALEERKLTMVEEGRLYYEQKQ